MAIEVEPIKIRLQKLEECIKRLEPIAQIKRDEFLRDIALQDIAERNLQVALECCLDIGNNLISELGLRRPKDYTEIISILAQEEVIPNEFAQKIKGMAGLRNILVHNYLDIDLSKIYQNLKSLDDLREFARHIALFIEKK